VTYIEYLNGIDDSHQMTTSREHIAAVCRLAAGSSRILELGSHAGISTAAIAMAAPDAEVVSVDLCDTIPEGDRVAYWASLGVFGITPVQGDAGDYIRASSGRWGLVFHDAMHGDAVVPEYLRCAAISDWVAIHDWDQLSPASRGVVMAAFSEYFVAAPDSRGRLLFAGRSK